MVAMSWGLIPLRLPPGPGWISTPSMTYSGSLLARIDVVPRMRTERLPSNPRVTVTPGKRPISTCSIGWPGWRAMSSAVTTELGGAAEVLVSCRWTQAPPRPTSRPTVRSVRVVNQVIGVLQRVEV